MSSVTSEALEDSHHRLSARRGAAGRARSLDRARSAVAPGPIGSLSRVADDRGRLRTENLAAAGDRHPDRTCQEIRKLAETFLQRWVRFADDHGLVAVAPLFDHNFGSWVSEPGIVLGGYRGLAGKEIGADEFVERLVDQYRGRAGDVERFYLYGHSAGGQFAGRYAVRHPDRLKALVLSAPGRYAFPDPQAPWPYGQKEVTVRASAQEASRVIRPDPDGWRKAAALPITVVVGTADIEPQPPRIAHVGTTRVDYARQWVEAMTRIAPEGKSRIRLVTVPRIGHSSAGLTPACQRALAESLGGS